MTTEQAIELIARFRAKNESDLLHILITDALKVNLEKYSLWLEYKGEIPIKSRVLEIGNEYKSNVKVGNDFRGIIVDQATGYMFGTPIDYSFENELTDTDLAAFNSFLSYIKIAKLDSSTATYTGVCGNAVRLGFIDKAGKINAINVPPWECWFILDESNDQVQYAIRYYDIDYYEGTEKTVRRKVEFYDDKQITFYLSNAEKDSYTKDPLETQNPLPHGFKEVPLVKIKNNELEQSDFYKVRSYCDAYDIVVSDAVNELVDFRLAYLIFYGTEPDADTLQKARQTGAFGADATDRIEYLTKNINDTFVENTKKTLEKNIYRFAKAVDMSDEHFSGSGQSGESRKWRLVDLENKCVTKERFYEDGSINFFRVIVSAFSTLGVNFPVDSLILTFKRNLPQDLLYESDVTSRLKGNVPEYDRLKLLSFIDDADKAITEMQEEAGISFDNIPDIEPEE